MDLFLFFQRKFFYKLWQIHLRLFFFFNQTKSKKTWNLNQNFQLLIVLSPSYFLCHGRHGKIEGGLAKSHQGD